MPPESANAAQVDSQWKDEGMVFQANASPAARGSDRGSEPLWFKTCVWWLGVMEAF
jgi:hypothetical protein